MSPTIGEPFQFFLGSTLSQKVRDYDAVACTHNRGYATVTAQGDGIHVWDLQNLHPVASYAVDKHVVFAAPAFSLHVTEDGNRSVISYAVLSHSPDIQKYHRGRIIWIIRQSLFGSTVATDHRTAIVVPYPPVRISGTGNASVPLLLVSGNGSLFLANERVDIKSQLIWCGERKHLETFIFPREECSFIQEDTVSYNRAIITCCHTSMILHVRLVILVGEEIVPIATCEILLASPTTDTNIVILGLTCSSSGILTLVDSCGIWSTYQLTSLNSSLVSTPVFEKLHIHRFSAFKGKKSLTRKGFSVVSLGTSLVLLVGLVEKTRDLSLQIWDLSYGILLTTQSMPLPSENPSMHTRLTVADQGQILLTVSPATTQPNATPQRSSIHIVPVDPHLRSNLAAALGKIALTAKWLTTSDGRKPDDQSDKIISDILSSLQKNNAQQAEQVFLQWLASHSSTEAALGHEFVKNVFNIVLPLDPSTNYPYTPRITRSLLENAVVSTIMLNGRLITALRQRGDWENVMLALTTVTDVSEDELMASAKFLIDRQRRNENVMQVDASEGYVPPLFSYLFACVSYPFSVVPMRMAIRKYLADAQDLVVILEVLEGWVQGGTEHEIEALLKWVATKTQMASSGANSPPYPKVITFLQALLDASFVALLQYQPSYDLLHRILSHIEPEITLIDSLEPLRGTLEPFVKAQILKEKMGAPSKESPAERRMRKKQLEQQDNLNVGLYRLEELVI